jgi:hypothetical protein
MHGPDIMHYEIINCRGKSRAKEQEDRPWRYTASTRSQESEQDRRGNTATVL